MEYGTSLTPQDWDRAYIFGKDYTPITNESLDKILSYLPEDGGKIAIDLGCGTGQLVRELAQRGFVVTGLDRSTEAVRLAKSDNNTNSIKYEIVDFEMDFVEKQNQLADLITCKYVYAFIEKRSVFLRNVQNLLKPDSRFVIINPLKNTVPEHKKHITISSEKTKEELKEYFKLLDYYDDGSDEYFVCKLKSAEAWARLRNKTLS